MPLVSTYRAPLTTRQLLVSVQDSAEAIIAHKAGVPWIDLKNPQLGSLGRPSRDTSQQFFDTLTALPNQPHFSVALGELEDGQTLAEEASLLLSLFPIAKIGLAHQADSLKLQSALSQLMARIDTIDARTTQAAMAGSGALAEKVATLVGSHSDTSHRDASPSGANKAVSLSGSEVSEPLQQWADHKLVPAAKIVLAIYADWQYVSAPPPGDVMELARRYHCPYVLVDTCRKQGLGLFHYMSPGELIELREQAASFGAQLVVAGSLRESDWPKLDQLGPIIVGVRGAVCRTSEDRTSSLSPERIERWLKWSMSFRGSPSTGALIT